ncbi:hypothetical protein SAY87_008801 [Trapa incisa]|uniref:Gnk2-homologous domain-containing protein n=1 Tax=Trapa incisa TaxID=236973 RepID=A0AAN7PWI0_9MYRT|nr:hypothetical protein SAY87_008801 [Trapa incisa]
MDPSLGSGQRSEIQRCIHIGLLCVQENATSRPTMASVVMMLNSFSTSLPLPTKPAFYAHNNTRPSGISVAANSSGGNNPDEPRNKSLKGSINECSPDLSEQQCSDCLEETIGKIPECCSGKIGGRLFRPSCKIRFELNHFYNELPEAQSTTPVSPPPTSRPTNTTSEGNSSSRTHIIIIAVVASSIFLCIIVISIFFFCRPKQRKPVENNDEAVEDEIRTAASLKYDFAIISAATDNFSEDNKLGQGGFGPVYKVPLEKYWVVYKGYACPHRWYHIFLHDTLSKK